MHIRDLHKRQFFIFNGNANRLMHCIGMTRPRSRYSGHRRVCEGRVGVEKPGAGAVESSPVHSAGPHLPDLRHNCHSAHFIAGGRGVLCRHFKAWHEASLPGHETSQQQRGGGVRAVAGFRGQISDSGHTCHGPSLTSRCPLVHRRTDTEIMNENRLRIIFVSF